jgi:Fe-S cluster biogenesis protein NfuA
MAKLDARAFQARLERLDALLRQADSVADPAARARLQEVVQAVLDLHGAALERMLALLGESVAGGRGVLDACARDDVVGGLLLLHGLHPLDLEARVRQALEGVRPYLRAHGGTVELLGVSGGVVRLRLGGNCDGCPSSAVTMKQTIEEAIYAKAPDVEGIEVEGALEHAPAPAEGPARLALPLV